ncbi:MAG TPA: hypothetical protein VF389_05355 [Woeseiaceae bacterium]
MDFGLIEMAFTFGVVLALAFWELFNVRKSRDKPADDSSDNSAEKDMTDKDSTAGP